MPRRRRTERQEAQRPRRRYGKQSAMRTFDEKSRRGDRRGGLNDGRTGPKRVSAIDIPSETHRCGSLACCVNRKFDPLKEPRWA
jgi:hypothetical protein